ncbi:hypothetical protein OQA88_9242 [Cercophora sp. LCS_1]
MTPLRLLPRLARPIQATCIQTPKRLPTATTLIQRTRPLHTTTLLHRKTQAHNNEPVTEQPPPTDFSQLDVLGDAPVPSTSVTACLDNGFALNSGVRITGGSGALLVGGEAFAWRPWDEKTRKLVNGKGQWEVGKEGFGLLSVVWPRPDLLILGLGPEMRPLSPETRRLISGLGMRVEVLDTRNAAAQFNLLATERGVAEVAAALVPVGWKEGVGAE